MTDLNQWIIERINQTETQAGLDYLADVIKADAEDGAEYAIEPQVKAVRTAWARRKKEIQTLDVLAFDGTLIERKSECQQ